MHVHKDVASWGYGEKFDVSGAVLECTKISPLFSVDEFCVARSFAECASAHSCKIWLGIDFCSEWKKLENISS